MQHAVRMQIQVQRTTLQRQQRDIPLACRRTLQNLHNNTNQAQIRLDLLDPSLVLQRGYAWLQDMQGRTISKIEQAHAGLSVRATLADGTVDMLVAAHN